MVSGLLVLSAAGVPGYLFPLRCFAFTHVVSVPFCSQIFVPGWFVLHPLRWCPPSPPVHRFSLGWPPRSISLLQLSLLLCLWGGSGLRVFLLLAFGPLGSLFVLSPWPWSSHGFCSVFLPSLPSWSVGSPGSQRLGMPLRSGVLFPGYPCSVSSVVSVRFPSLLPLLLLRCFPAWWLFFP